MTITSTQAGYHLNDVLSQREYYEAENQRNGIDELQVHQLDDLYTAYLHALERCSPPGSVYYRRMVEIVAEGGHQHYQILRLEGLLRALRRDWIGDRLQTFTELVHGELFSDMLEAASHLLNQGYKDAAAMTAGGVLEQHIRNLCHKHSIPTTSTKDGDTVPKKLDALNAELTKDYANGKQDQKEVTWMAGLRNQAAHGEYSKYDGKQVELMILGVRGFVNRNPA